MNVASPRRRRAVLLARTLLAIGLILLVGYGTALLSIGHSQLARAVVWLESDVDDWQRFPARTMAASGQPFAFERAESDATERAFAAAAESLALPTDDLEQFLDDTRTTAFIVIRDDAIIAEWYGNGADAQATQTSFSMAKSYVATLVGIAIDEGAISSADDPITQYVPELLQSDPRFARITLDHLLTMSSGISYVEQGLPWSDDATTYYAPDLRAAALAARIAGEPGEEWLYNNYNPLLLGLVLERATGESVAAFAERTLWRRIGTEGEGSWSLDSERSGFEKMESGVNARAIDFAKLGRLALREGEWEGERIVDAQWMRDATSARGPSHEYGRFWWVADEGGTGRADFFARGNFGQFIYVAPETDTIIVRLGREPGYDHWPALLDRLAAGTTLP
ncbi:MAG: serine hydrolase [Microcella sp.]|uniref:serine hydrolase domain-containing protein n=1 Tax=Microcella sp. TaxID=1913979 RepID=UPI0033160C5B